MEIKDILTIVSTIASFLLVTLIPTIIGLIKKWKAAKAAKTDAEKQSIYNDMLNQVTNLIENAETTFSALDKSLKAQSLPGCGAQKKSQVMDKLQLYAIQKGIDFDTEYWSKKVDEVVAVTKKVNAKEA